ncbi:uncharacterized protein LOC8278978 isoform X2 [Ricinus communis]|uniref:uncharacterized protein LOC8278978 isoform X2 n=1 Tax=Ricinus communis TaxID=3988 RepID=UPI00201B1D2D|nr:uncharacterized protein LOC8278978 isoform X2 [Ricinus communis]
MSKDASGFLAQFSNCTHYFVLFVNKFINNSSKERKKKKKKRRKQDSCASVSFSWHRRQTHEVQNHKDLARKPFSNNSRLIINYCKRLERMERMTGRPSDGYGRGKSRFRGVVRNGATGKWLAKKGSTRGCFLGSYETEEEAAVAFDVGCIKQYGYQAITNYDLRCYDVESILKAHQLFLQQQAAMLAMQRARLSAMQKQQQPLKRPIASHLDIVPRNLATPEQRSQFEIWAQETARKELAQASNFSSFQHGEFSPFSSYQESRSSFLGFRHGSSASQFEACIPGGQCSHKTLDTVPLLGPYQLSAGIEMRLRAQGLGFEHAASSSFKPYAKESGNKMKGKVTNF